MTVPAGRTAGMTASVTLAYEGPPVCIACANAGATECGHTGFVPEHWQHLPGMRVHVPGLDASDDYPHVARHVEISPDRKTVTITTETARPMHHDLARHLSVQAWTPPAAVRAVHKDTGDTLEEGHYERPLNVGETVRIDLDRYVVTDVQWPNRDEYGVSGDLPDLQVATLTPMPQPTVSPVQTGGGA